MTNLDAVREAEAAVQRATWLRERALERRSAAILAAVEAGVRAADVSRATGVSQVRVSQILRRARADRAKAEATS